MGNCFGKSSTQRRHDNWKATGIVSSRDGGLRSIPSNALAIAGSVRTLDLSNNAISDIAEQDLQGFSQIQRLVLAGNRLGQLPRSIGSLTQLKHLALDSNKLTQLPAELGQLQRLEVLLLHGNQLAALPDALGSCKALKTLNVSSNRMTALPSALGDCNSLQVSRCCCSQVKLHLQQQLSGPARCSSAQQHCQCYRLAPACQHDLRSTVIVSCLQLTP
jgi:Leucine-rich repeat (LRR) protein